MWGLVISFWTFALALAFIKTILVSICPLAVAWGLCQNQRGRTSSDVWAACVRGLPSVSWLRIFRCASISWFQVVRKSVIDIFLQLAHLRVFQSYLGVFLTLYYDYMCSETDFTQEIVDFHVTTGIPNSSSYCCSDRYFWNSSSHSHNVWLFLT